MVKNIPEEAYVLVDLNHLRLIFRNLIHNAIKFSTAQSAVTISAVPAYSFWKITIQDTGIGMTEQEVNMVLNSNYFTKHGTSQEKGTGLGLMLCREFIRLNQGKLEVVSKPQAGTSISFFLPVA
jgi:signal transduction histidine kinase